jgi:hypothetical protein
MSDFFAGIKNIGKGAKGFGTSIGEGAGSKLGKILRK